jgi:hypothetical protein
MLLYLPLLDSFLLLFFSSSSVFIFTTSSFVCFSSSLLVYRSCYRCRYFTLRDTFGSPIAGTYLNQPSWKEEDIIPFPSNVAVQWITLIGFREVLGSDLSWETWLRTLSFSPFPVCKVCDRHQITLRLLPSKSFPIHYSLLIVPLDGMYEVRTSKRVAK